MTALPSGTVTFLLTDIESSTKRWDSRSAAMAAALRRHDALVRQAIEANGGHVFQTVGDAFCAASATAPVTGTTDWARYEVVLDVPSERVNVAFGVRLSGSGQVWASELALDEVGSDVPATGAAGGVAVW